MAEKAELSVIAPCFNEERNVPVLVERALRVFDRMPIRCELVLIDDGSRDGTWAAICEAARTHDRVVGRKHEKNGGIVAGWVTGLEAAGGSLVCLIDSDLQNRPEDIPRLYEAYAPESCEIVQAVRHPKLNKNRIVFSKGLNAILNVTFQMSLRDNKSGFVLCRREVLEEILEDAPGYRYFQSFIGAAAGVRGLRIVEVDTEFDARHAGESFLSNFPIRTSLRIVGELARYRYETLAKPKRRRN